MTKSMEVSSGGTGGVDIMLAVPSISSVSIIGTGQHSRDKQNWLAAFTSLLGIGDLLIYRNNHTVRFQRKGKAVIGSGIGIGDYGLRLITVPGDFASFPSLA